LAPQSRARNPWKLKSKKERERVTEMGEDTPQTPWYL
jgi:hypothetical protein